MFIVVISSFTAGIVTAANFYSTNRHSLYLLSENDFYGSQILYNELSDTLESIHNMLTTDDKELQNTIYSRLSKEEGLYFSASKGNKTFVVGEGNNKNYFKEYPVHIIVDNNDMTVYPVKLNNHNETWFMESLQYGMDGHIYMAIGEEYTQPIADKWSSERAVVLNIAKETLVYLAGFIIGFIILAVSAWRKGKRQDAKRGIYTDISLMLGGSIILAWVFLMMEIYGRYYYDPNMRAILATGGAALIGFPLLFTMTKDLSMGEFLKHSLIYKVFRWLKEVMIEMYSNGNLGVKLTIIILGYTILCVVLPLLAPLAFLVVMWLLLKQVKDFHSLKSGMEKVRKGELSHKVILETNGELSKLANEVNEISCGLQEAVENEIKSERLKSELITNVSHDIRTPLTSIITYVDLLKKEEKSEKANDYVEILEQKANRLKVLTDDLFEASKASSGNIPVHLEKIDVIALIKQGLGELNHVIEEKGLIFKLNREETPCYVQADGRLLWRVMENLLSNIFKYAMTGSRVYLDIIEDQDDVTIVMKNISNHALNIPVDELMVRFKRGDEARSSEGSGLGLSIAQSLTELQGGQFRVDIDGDLFKAIINIPKSFADSGESHS